jgi:hypothetical protein
MATEDDRVIYIQRYETFRHFDSLRWQIPTISLTGGSVLLGLTTSSANSLPPWWAFLLLSFLLALSSYAVYRIRIGIHTNNEVLSLFADKLGDKEVPKPTESWGASWWYVLLLAALSFMSLITSVILVSN